MNYLTYLALPVTLISINVDAGQHSNPVYKALESASKSSKVPIRLLTAICKVESRLRPLAVNLNDKGSPSYGMCQIKLKTARDMGFTGRISDLYNPYVNALYSSKYLSHQLHRYNGDWIKAVSAYNRGSAGAVIKNKRYVHKVVKEMVGSI